MAKRTKERGELKMFVATRNCYIALKSGQLETLVKKDHVVEVEIREDYPLPKSLVPYEDWEEENAALQEDDLREMGKPDKKGESPAKPSPKPKSERGKPDDKPQRVGE